jgi:hypothetical protein
MYRQEIMSTTTTTTTTAPSQNPLEQFRWTPQPEAERLVKEIVDGILARDSTAASFRDRMRDEAGVRFIDCIDHLVVDQGHVRPERLMEAGFERSDMLGGCYAHPGGIFPPIRLTSREAALVHLKVESVADFAAANGNVGAFVGQPGDRFRIGVVGADFAVVERHGYRGPVTAFGDTSDGQVRAAMRHTEFFRLRRRFFHDDAEGFAHAGELIDRAVQALGVDWACDLFFATEREYWQRRNRAGQFQKARQDRLGLGWANHDHHTYRSSRRHFPQLIAMFEKLGFTCRERFYAGAEAGWGAQVLEQPVAGIVIFADVDLSPEELFLDFAHNALPPRQQMGTVGLWCALHGEAFLQAGMHHLECQFDFESLKRQMETDGGIKVMKPFTDFPYLRQAFTEGERWPVAEDRLAAVLAAGQLSPEQAEQIRRDGAIGSHLENLERNEGFKGFNQKGVSEIIAKTDPRKQLA